MAFDKQTRDLSSQTHVRAYTLGISWKRIDGVGRVECDNVAIVDWELARHDGFCGECSEQHHAAEDKDGSQT
eukprot:2510159-Rhodomonas_salina.2